MKTYGDVYLTRDGRACQEDGYEFLGWTRERKLVYGIGVNNFPFQTGRPGNSWKPYVLWYNMLRRAYDPKHHTQKPTYIGVEVESSWHSFSAFLDWLMEQPFRSADFHLDKDIIGRGNFYGTDDCLMVPQWVNSLAADSGADRGDLPLGVTKNRNGFRARVSLGDGTRLGKTFRTIEEASDFYRTEKQKYVDSRKDELDAIDERLYPNLCRILNERRAK